MYLSNNFGCLISKLLVVLIIFDSQFQEFADSKRIFQAASRMSAVNTHNMAALREKAQLIRAFRGRGARMLDEEDVEDFEVSKLTLKALWFTF